MSVNLENDEHINVDRFLQGRQEYSFAALDLSKCICTKAGEGRGRQQGKTRTGRGRSSGVAGGPGAAMCPCHACRRSGCRHRAGETALGARQPRRQKGGRTSASRSSQRPPVLFWVSHFPGMFCPSPERSHHKGMHTQHHRNKRMT